jgi:hypothetical protein
MKTLRLFCLIVSLAAFVAAAEPKTALQKDGKTVANYAAVPTSFKPYIDELRTPSGKNILRDAPHDHLHHHALMYATRVGGHNFWEENDPNAGKQITTQLDTVGKGAIESNIDWNVPESKTLVQEVRKISLVPQTENVTLLDWQSTLKAVNDTVLGDAGSGHYHGLGMRFVPEMDKGGRFFNSTGKNDGEIVRGDERLTPCRWMAYMAKLEGQPVTVALFDYPSNPIPMTAFTMGDAGGAFAYMSATTNFYRKPIPLKAGETFSVKYRVAVWDGEISPETVEKAYSNYIR